MDDDKIHEEKTDNFQLNFFKDVNKTTSPAELIEVILFYSQSGFIAGRTRLFNAKKMISYIPRLESGELIDFRLLTRQYGIRQQMMYLMSQKEGKIG